MPSWHPAGAALAALALALTLTVAPATGAVAHEQLLSSSPGDGERLDRAPGEVRLQFTADLLGLGAVVLVADGDDRNWTVGDAVVEGAVVTIPIDPAIPVGGYEIRWRVVSGDGHPISDIIPFTIGDASPLAIDRAPEATTAEQAAQQTTDLEESAILRSLLVGLGGALAAGGAFALITLLGRRRARRSDDPPLASTDAEHLNSKGTS